MDDEPTQLLLLLLSLLKLEFRLFVRLSFKFKLLLILLQLFDLSMATEAAVRSAANICELLISGKMLLAFDMVATVVLSGDDLLMERSGRLSSSSAKSSSDCMCSSESESLRC